MEAQNRRLDDRQLGVGVGLRTPHYREMLERRPDLGFLEVHSENYFGEGGQPHFFLSRLRESYPVSLHGVGLSLGSADGLDLEHLRRLKALAGRYQPVRVSDHLCWGAAGGRHSNDLLPLPYTQEALEVAVRNIQTAQDYLGRQILVENVSTYLPFAQGDMPEWEFVAEVSRRSDCGILLDINNLYVNAVNFGFDARAYLRAIPAERVKEMHLAGYEDTGHVLIDTHGHPIYPAVWDLYRMALAQMGPVATLIEWDTDIPPLGVLLEEAGKASALMEVCHAAAC